MFRIEIETTNAAFEDAPEDEITRILRDLADYIAQWSLQSGRQVYQGVLRDINGNTVGTWQYTPEEEPIEFVDVNDPEKGMMAFLRQTLNPEDLEEES